MSLPTRIAAYDDCFEVFAQALANRGARVAFRTRNEARFFMLRMQQARALEREESKRLYQSSDPKWNYSEYDKLMVRAPREGEADEVGELWWIYIDFPHANIITIESLDQPTLESTIGNVR